MRIIQTWTLIQAKLILVLTVFWGAVHYYCVQRVQGMPPCLTSVVQYTYVWCSWGKKLIHVIRKSKL